MSTSHRKKTSKKVFSKVTKCNRNAKLFQQKNLSTSLQSNNFAPHFLQYSASVSCPSLLHDGQLFIAIFDFIANDISAVTIPVGIAIMLSQLS